MSIAYSCLHLIVLFMITVSFSLQAKPLFDPAAVWPLCGRIMDNPPENWSVKDGCPAERFGNPAYADVQQGLESRLLHWMLQTSDVTPFETDPRGLPA